MDEVTLFITSCDRPELLKITLESFMEFNTYPIKEAIIIEDSGKKNINDFAYKILNMPLKIIYNDKNLGLIKSTLKGIQYIKTDLVFHCEEDWRFYKSGFIEDSLNILKNDKNVTLVSLIKYDRNTMIEPIPNKNYYYAKENGKTGGYSANPSLRYKNVYELYNNFETEGDISKDYLSKNMHIAFTQNEKGYVGHIGKRNSVYRKYKDTNKI